MKETHENEIEGGLTRGELDALVAEEAKSLGYPRPQKRFYASPLVERCAREWDTAALAAVEELVRVFPSDVIDDDDEETARAELAEEIWEDGASLLIFEIFGGECLEDWEDVFAPEFLERKIEPWLKNKLKKEHGELTATLINAAYFQSVGTKVVEENPGQVPEAPPKKSLRRLKRR